MQDLLGNEVVLLFNESKEEMQSYIKKFNNSKYVRLQTPEEHVIEIDPKIQEAIRKLNEFTGKKSVPKRIVQRVTHKFDILKFVEYGLSRNFDWVIFTREEWEAAQPKKKKKFIKPRRK
jgi:hypothetical protein